MAGSYDAIVIGGGFFGSRMALHLRNFFDKVLVLENEAELMTRASLNNQARVHGGYHYPRSLLTGLRSQANFDRFVEEYFDCIDAEFEQYYAIGRNLSKVSSAQFEQFCLRINAPIGAAPSHVKDLFNPDLIEDVFVVREYAFDAVKLRKQLLEQLLGREVTIKTAVRAETIAKQGDQLRLTYRSNGQLVECTAPRVYNCTYSQINQLNHASGLPIIPLKHEVAEIALVEMPESLKNVGVTVMCGPFFSMMPFPSRGLHSFSHVRYTPHTEWADSQDSYVEPHLRMRDFELTSAFPKMLADAKRYIKLLERCQYRDSLWEVKTVLPQSEADDSRPILFRRDHGLPGYTCVMGGKFDNVYDALKELDTTYVPAAV